MKKILMILAALAVATGWTWMAAHAILTGVPTQLGWGWMEWSTIIVMTACSWAFIPAAITVY